MLSQVQSRVHDMVLLVLTNHLDSTLAFLSLSNDYDRLGTLNSLCSRWKTEAMKISSRAGGGCFQ